MGKSDFRLGTLLITFILGGCATPVVFDAYDGPRKPDSELALLSLGDGSGVTSIHRIGSGPPVSLRGYNGTLLKLIPGQYDIDYAGSFSVGKRSYVIKRSDTLDLKEGHRYILIMEQCDNMPATPKELVV